MSQRTRTGRFTAGLAAVLTAAAGFAAAPAAAGAHTVIRESGAEVSLISDDATSRNTVAVTVSGARIALRDPTVDGGMDIGSCEPGDTDERGFIIEAFCRLAGITLLRIDVGEREDEVTTDLPVSVLLFAGEGADTVRTGPAGDTVLGEGGDDDLRTGAGGDKVQGGLGADRIDSGSEDDVIVSRDGLTDVVACGDGADEVDGDQADQIAPDCEDVSRTDTAPPAGAGSSSEPDRTPPRVQVGGARRQRLGRSRLVTVTATATEAGTVAASGYLEVAGVRLPVSGRQVDLLEAGDGVKVKVRLSKGQARRARRALRRGRRVVVRLSVVATDAAGNSATRRAPRIRLT